MRAWQLFFKQTFSPEGHRGVRLRTFVLEFLVALSLAFLVWIYTRSREQTSLDQIEIPVQITLAPGTAGNYELEINGSSRIPMSFTGPPSRVRELRTQIHRGLLQVTVQVTVPEEHQKDSVYHDVVRIEPESVTVPPGVATVITEGRNTIPYTLHRLVERHLPVRLDYAGEDRISQIKLDPPTVMVRGPKELLDRARDIPTQPYTLPLTTEAAVSTDNMHSGQASLVRELDGRAIVTTPTSVSFRFRIHPRQQIYDLKDVPVRFLCPPECAWRAKFASPDNSKVALKVVGPAGDELPTVLAFVDLTRADLGQGRNVLPLRVELPKEFRLIDDAPRLVPFYLDPIEQSATEPSMDKPAHIR